MFFKRFAYVGAIISCVKRCLSYFLALLVLCLFVNRSVKGPDSNRESY